MQGEMFIEICEPNGELVWQIYFWVFVSSYFSYFLK